MSTQPGFAIRRNGTCLSGYETDCGGTVPPFRGCCPVGFQCPQQYNVVCCPPGEECSASLNAAPEPKCSNSTWDLYDNGGYFCCEHGLEGFNKTSTFSNICAEPGTPLSGVVALPIISTGQSSVSSATPTPSASSLPFPSSIASSSPTSDLSTTTQSPSSESNSPNSQSSSTPVGPIVGGVVGGLAGLALLGLAVWFVMRRKRNDSSKASQEVYEVPYEGAARIPPQQLDSDQTVFEAGDGKTRYAHAKELPANEAVAELPGDSVAPR